MAVRVTAPAGVLGRFAAAFGDDAVPFPTREGRVYYVEGRRTIPRGCEISAQKDLHLVGHGSDAVLAVEGALQAHGLTAGSSSSKAAPYGPRRAARACPRRGSR